MSNEQNVDQASPRPVPPPETREHDDRSACRLPNLQKLYHVPVFALRGLLQSRIPDRDFGPLRQAELITEADRLSSITPVDVDNLYENYRYGQRLSFYLYLLPEGLAEPSTHEMQEILDDPSMPDPPDSAAGSDADQDYESDVTSNEIILLDEEQLNGIREIRFRYYVGHRFLNAAEQPDYVQQTRYGFVWLDLKLGFLTVLSRDEHVNHLLTQALSHALQAVPVPARFNKELIDKHFSIERIKRVSHYDPGTGMHQSISGRGLWKMFQEEILDREELYTRPSSLYHEDVGDGLVSGLGITASKGKIYLTKTLPTSLLRAWARRRLPELVSDLKDLRSQRPELFARSAEAINRMRLPAAGRAAITTIVEALLQADRDDLASVPLPLPALEIYDALAGKYFTPYLRLQCTECEEMAELCPHCESPDLEFKKGHVRCKDCQATLSDQTWVTLRCMDGHTKSVALVDAFSMAPNHWLQKRIVRILHDLGKSWDEKSDYFHIEDSTLYRLYKGRARVEKLAPTVQNFVNNFWDLVGGPVHTGSGDIVVDRTPAPQKLAQKQRHGAALRVYRNLDLRLRGTVSAGYTVEAAVSDGGSVPPQPLRVPPDRAFKIAVNSMLRQSTNGRTIQAVGRALFHALFPAQIARLWASARGQLQEEEGLRIRLHIDSPELMALPWELIFDTDHIGLHLRFPVVRYLDLPDPPKPLAVQPPLRILVAVSQPEDVPSLKADAELAAIRKALAQMPDSIELDVLDSATREEMLSRLRRGYHVLHYIGHGAFEGEQGYLILEDGERKSDPVSASLLSQIVTDSNLRLAVLNACETSTPGLKSPFGGLAHQLVRTGMPAIVAMQVPIAENAAFSFSREFYGALADGWPVDAAVQQGRRSIMTDLGNSWSQRIDWAIPTLYMRAPDGVILQT